MRISWKRVTDLFAKLREKDLDKVQGNLKIAAPDTCRHPPRASRCHRGFCRGLTYSTEPSSGNFNFLE